MFPPSAKLRAKLLLLYPARIVLACAFTKVVAVVTERLPYFSWGGFRWVLLATIGFAYHFWLGCRMDMFNRVPEPQRFTRPARDAAVIIVLVPLGMLVGRNVFSIVPPWDPLLGAVIGGCLSVFAWCLFDGTSATTVAYARAPSITVQRGAELTPLEWAIAAAERLPADRALQPIWWSGVRLPAYTEAPAAIVGAPGTGKTRVLRQVMQTTLSQFHPGLDMKALVFDPKGDFLSERRRLGVTCPVHVMNAYDKRAARWAIANDVTPGRADQVAAALIPHRKHDTNPFFANAARGLAAATFVALAHRYPGTWTLRDFVLITSDFKRLKRFLQSCPATRDQMKLLGATPRVLANVMQELSNATKPLRPIAALYDSAPKGTKEVGLTAWVRGKEDPSVVVLGVRQSKAENCEVINRLMFSVIADAVLDEPDLTKRSRFWFFIDELADAGKLVGLNELMRRGRSRGARFYLTFQNLPGLKANFADEKVDELTGLVGNLTVLHIDCPTTAEWASRRIGDAEVLARTTSVSTGTTENAKDTSTSSNKSLNEALVTRRAVLQGELLHLGAARPDGSVDGFHMLREVNAVYKATLRFSFHEPDPEEDFQPRDDGEAELREWGPEDAARAKSKGDGQGCGRDEADNDDETIDNGEEDLVTGTAQHSPPARTQTAPKESTTAVDALSRLKRIKRMDV